MRAKFGWMSTKDFIGKEHFTEFAIKKLILCLEKEVSSEAASALPVDFSWIGLLERVNQIAWFDQFAKS